MSALARIKHAILVRVLTYIYNRPSWVQLFESIRAKRNGEKVFDFYRGEVQIGPFKGTRLPKSSVDDAPEFGANWILGTFEQQISNIIRDKSWKNVINVGAAQGWYGVALLLKNQAKNVYFFESDTLLHPIIREFASANGVLSEITILGHADEDFLSSLNGVSLLSDTLVLVDIEGGESSLLSDENILTLANCHLIIELHEFTPEMLLRGNDLISRLAQHFEITILDGLTREVPRGLEISGVNDQDIHHLTYEFRPNAMRWISCSPKI